MKLTVHFIFGRVCGPVPNLLAALFVDYCFWSASAMGHPLAGRDNNVKWIAIVPPLDYTFIYLKAGLER